MRRKVWRLLGYSSLLGCFCLLYGVEQTKAQGGAPRPARRAGPAVPATTPPAAGATAPVAQPLAPEASITLDAGGLSVDVQEQDLHAVVARIAALGQIDIRHLEGVPHRRVSVRFTALPVVDGLKRLFRVADVPGYVLVTAPRGPGLAVQRIVFLAEENAPTTPGARGASRPPAVAAAPPRPALPSPGLAALPPDGAPAPPQADEARGAESTGRTSVFDDLKSNAAARRLLSQMMHPNEQVRERAFEGLVRVFREDEKQRALMEFLEPLMEDLTAEDKGAQDSAREEIRKLLSR